MLTRRVTGYSPILPIDCGSGPPAKPVVLTRKAPASALCISIIGINLGISVPGTGLLDIFPQLFSAARSNKEFISALNDFAEMSRKEEKGDIKIAIRRNVRIR